MPDEAPEANQQPATGAGAAPAPPPVPVPAPEAPGAPQGGVAPAPATMPTTGRQAFRDIRRQLTDAELANPGVQKIILDDFERAELRCVEMEAYVDRFHAADKRAGVLEEKLRTERALEVFFGLGTGFGGAIVGLAPFLFELFDDNKIPGIVALVLGAGMIAGASIGRAIKR